MPKERSVVSEPIQKADFLNIPAYRLYGEEWTRSVFGFFHIETLAVRNIPNLWHIKPHRHLDFDQMSILLEGHCVFSHDGRQGTAEAVSCVYTPVKVVHQFHYSPGASGFVITISSDFLAGLPSIDGAPSSSFLRLARHRVATLRSDDQIANLKNLLDLCARNARLARRHQRDVLRLLVSSLILEFDAAIEEPRSSMNTSAGSNDAGVFRRFNELVQSTLNVNNPDSQKRPRELTVETFAAQLGVTRYSLNAACQSICGSPARELIQSAILEQATRLLLYSTLSVKEISFALGYSHASHFTRFFKQRRGYSPEAFRHASLAPTN
jgi:AraC family transcriptional regulator, transcriptional activator of pobA